MKTAKCVYEFLHVISWADGPGGRAVCGRSLAGIAGSNPSWGMDMYFVRVVLSGRGLCDGPITRLEKSYRVSCV
jgi:hypothetical protein